MMCDFESMRLAIRKPVIVVVLLSFLVAVSGCHDTIWVHSHPPGAQLLVDGRPYGTIPESGLPVDVHWWTFSTHEAELRWPGNVLLHTTLRKGIGEPHHPEYLVLDGVLAIFFLVPGIIAFCINGYGPTDHQHFHAPHPPAKSKDSKKSIERSEPPPES